MIGMCVCREGSEGVEGVQLSDVNGNRPRKYCNIYNVYSGCLVTMYLHACHILDCICLLAKCC